MDYLIPGLQELFQFPNYLLLALGVILGLFIGTLPGIGSTIGIALLLPLTYGLPPLGAIVMLTGVYTTVAYSGSISAIVLGVPGNPSAAAGMLDGNPMARNGYPGKAMGYALAGSSVGAAIGALVLMFLSLSLMQIAIGFAAAEFFLLGIIGLLCVASLSAKDVIKSTISVLLGVLIGMVGIDVLTGTARFTFGAVAIMDGMQLVPLLIGMFAVSEGLNMLEEEELNLKFVTDIKNIKVGINLQEFKGVAKDVIKSSLIGTFVGILPGMGGGPAAWVSLGEAQRSSKTPEKFGTGHANGIAAPEAGDNAASCGAMIPLLSLGIPGSPATAVIIGAFMIHGLRAGPMLVKEEPELVYGIFWGILLSCLVLYFVGRYTTTIFASLLMLPKYLLAPIILFLAILGSYGPRGNYQDVLLAVVVGIIAYFLRKLDFSLPSIVLGFILGPIIESGFRRALMEAVGDYTVFFTRTYCQILLVIIVFIVSFLIYTRVRLRKNKEENIASGE